MWQILRVFQRYLTSLAERPSSLDAIPSGDVRAVPDTVAGGTMESHSEGLDHATNRKSPHPSTQREEIFANFTTYSRIMGQELELLLLLMIL